MYFLPQTLAVSCLLSIAYQEALAAPGSIPSLPIRSIPLIRRTRSQRNGTEVMQWLKTQKDSLLAKYQSGSAHEKRASGANLCVICLLQHLHLFVTPAITASQTSSSIRVSMARSLWERLRLPSM